MSFSEKTVSRFLFIAMPINQNIKPIDCNASSCQKKRAEPIMKNRSYHFSFGTSKLRKLRPEYYSLRITFLYDIWKKRRNINDSTIRKFCFYAAFWILYTVSPLGHEILTFRVPLQPFSILGEIGRFPGDDPSKSCVAAHLPCPKYAPFHLLHCEFLSNAAQLNHVLTQMIEASASAADNPKDSEE